MMKKFHSAVLAGTAVLAVTFGASSASAATASATATAKIVSPIQVFQDAQLNFGTIVPAAAAANVSISTGGVRTCAASLTCSGTAAAGAFHATGSANENVTITTDTTTSLTSGANTMAVNSIAPSASTGTFSGTGSVSFTVGATLVVGANQVAGVYNGNYNVNVNYQ